MERRVGIGVEVMLMMRVNRLVSRLQRKWIESSCGQVSITKTVR